MKAIDIDEMELRLFFRMVFDNRQYVQNGVVCVGFVSGRIIHASYYDTMTFQMAQPDATGLASLCSRINKALKKALPFGKIKNNVCLTNHADEGIVIEFGDE